MRSAWLLLTAAAALLGASCGSSPARRIEENPQVFQALNEREKAQVSRGQITEGMGKGAVWLAWGRADRVFAGSRLGKSYERWSYTGYEPVHGTALGYGYGGYGGGYGRHHRHASAVCYYDPFFYAEPLVQYVPYESRRVEFIGGRVCAWASGR